MMRKTLFVALASAGLLAACGGGGGDSSPNNPPASTTSTTISGVASKGPLKNAIVKVFAVNANGTLGALLKDGPTDDNGGYTLDLGSYTGAVQLVVEAAPGKTLLSKDEATGQDVPMPADFKLRATTVVAAPANNSAPPQSVSITPFTELATKIAEDSSGGLTAANIAGGAQVVFNLIGVDPVATKPLDAADPASANVDDAARKRYALWNAAVSQLAASTPTTTDQATLDCFQAAASDTGKRIQCASQQIAKAVVVANGNQATPAAAMVGLSTALVAVAANPQVNKVNVAVTSDDAIVKQMATVEDDVKAGTATPIVVNVSAETQSDVAKAKSFVARLRSNAAAMQSAPLDTGIAAGVQAFGDSLRDEAVKVTSNTANLARLAVMAHDLWNNYTSGATGNVNSPNIPGFLGGCTVYQGEFPTKFGPTGNNVDPYTAGATAATTIANAKWVGCSMNSPTQPGNLAGRLPAAAGEFRYRRTVLFNFAGAGASAGNVAYIGMTRKQFWDTASASVKDLNLLAAPVAGTVGATVTSGEVTALRMVGDLPPGVDLSTGQPLAAKYSINFNGAMTSHSSGAVQLAFSGGSFAVVPVGAASPSLTLDLSVGGNTVVVAPQDPTNAAQLAAARLNIAASVKTAQGELTGTLTASDFAVEAVGSDLQPHAIRFTGTLAAAGSSGTVATVLTGTLSVTDAGQRSVGFEGALTLPNRPALNLTLSVVETAAPTANSDGSYSVTARYVQDQVTVTLTGTRTPNGDTLSLQESGGVAISLPAGNDPVKLQVGGRDAATVDRSRNRVIYADGTFESIS